MGNIRNRNSQQNGVRKATVHPRYRNIVDGIFRVLRTEGVGALWAGTLPSLILVSNPSIQFLVYERTKWLFFLLSRRSGQTKLSAIEIFVAGAFAKLVATLLTYPLQVAQTRLRKQGLHSNNLGGSRRKEKFDKHSRSAKPCGTLSVLHRIYVQEGWRGLFVGVETKLWQTVLTAAFMFLTYEKMVVVINKIVGR
eukprot:g1301.t1